jgi:uncharacterized membrane protein YfhO
VKHVNSSNEEIIALKNINLKNEAVVNTATFEGIDNSYQKDSLSTISLKRYQPNHLTYESNNTKSGLAVFSEMYYENGWKSFIDGKEVPHLRANFLLRALAIPAGQHTIVFKYDPQVVKTGTSIVIISSILFLLLVVFGIYFEIRSAKKEPLA